MCADISTDKYLPEQHVNTIFQNTMAQNILTTRTGYFFFTKVLKYIS